MNNVYLFNLKNTKQEQSKKEMNNSSNQGQESEKILQQQLQFSIFKLIKYEIKSILMGKKSKQKVSELPADGKLNTIFSAIAKRSIEKELDLSNILSKLYQIDFLKLLLLDNNQLRLFNAVCKPIFSDNEKIQTNEEEKFFEKKNLGEDQEQQEINLENKQKNQSVTCSKNSIEEQYRDWVWFPNQQLELSDKILMESLQNIKKEQNDKINQKLLSIISKHTSLSQILEKDAKTTQRENNLRVPEESGSEKIINTQKSSQNLYMEINQFQNNLQFGSQIQQNNFENYQEQNDQIP